MSEQQHLWEVMCAADQVPMPSGDFEGQPAGKARRLNREGFLLNASRKRTAAANAVRSYILFLKAAERLEADLIVAGYTPRSAGAGGSLALVSTGPPLPPPAIAPLAASADVAAGRSIAVIQPTVTVHIPASGVSFEGGRKEFKDFLFDYVVGLFGYWVRLGTAVLSYVGPKGITLALVCVSVLVIFAPRLLAIMMVRALSSVVAGLFTSASEAVDQAAIEMLQQVSASPPIAANSTMLTSYLPSSLLIFGAAYRCFFGRT